MIEKEREGAEWRGLALRWSGHGTHKGEFMGVAATDKQWTATLTAIVRMTNGKFEEW